MATAIATPWPFMPVPQAPSLAAPSNANPSSVPKPMTIPPVASQHSAHPQIPRQISYKVNLAEEEDAADYRPGGYHPVHIMDTFSNGRYLVLRKMGWGHFSTVWLAKDNDTSRHVALKIMKSSRRYTETALDEIKLLQIVKSSNPTHPGYSHVVSFLDSFQHPGLHDQPHVCMTFEPLGENLLSLTQRCVRENKQAVAALGRRRPIEKLAGIDLAVAIPIVKTIAKQILLGLDYLHTECKLIHTDLKPENVLISLPNVEEVVRAELQAIPTSESIKASTRTLIGVPGGFNRTKSPSSLHNNQVYIFSSQPLSSPSITPSTSVQNSPMDRITLRMSAMQVTGTTAPAATTTAITTTTTGESNVIKTATSTPTGPVTVAAATHINVTTLSSSPRTTILGSGNPTTAAHPATAMGVVSSSSTEITAATSLVKSTLAPASPQPSTPAERSSATRPEAVKEITNPSPSSSSSSISSLVPQTPSDGSALSGSLPYTAASSFMIEDGSPVQPLTVPKIVKTEIHGEIKRDRSADLTETETVIGREGTPTARSTPHTGPSLLSQTAPKTHPPTSKSENMDTQFLAIPSHDSVPPSTNVEPKIGEAEASPPTPRSPVFEVPPVQIKIADLGNATPIHKKFTNDIQTRQYRSPEAILGMYEWDERVDVFSVACMVFEMLTGEYLFNPKSRAQFSKDDDHVAQIMELMGDGFSPKMKTAGKYSREIFRSNGSLRNIHKLHMWPLSDVMVDKYDYSKEDAATLAEFLEPMLVVDPTKRASAKAMIDHPWLST